MECTIISEPNEKRVVLSGQFTFADNHKFKQIIDSLNDPGLKAIALDFGTVDFIDSAGLGMLLLLRDECQNRNISITINSVRGQVEKIFMISKFDQLFSMRA
jgi:HptB-dependent secretion and biofilm anti anti-sigma factor